MPEHEPLPAKLQSTVNKNAASIFLIIEILCLNATVVLAETPHATPMLGVSSAWTGSELMESNLLMKRGLAASFDRNAKQSVQTSRSRSNVQQENHALKKASPNSGGCTLLNEKSLELILDNWQTNLKHLLADTPSRLATFSSWVSQKIGFSKRGTPTELKMASAPASIRVHLQPVTNNHSTWLTNEGRLKIVTAH
jgi:hypothetical protein